MIKIMVAGYYGFENVGDELILSVLIGQLRRKYSDVQIAVLSANPRKTTQLHKVKGTSRWNPLLILQEMWKVDLFVLGGGGLLQDKTSIGSLVYYTGLIALALFLKKRVFLYSLGVETIASSLGKKWVRFLLNHDSVTVTVRDRVSADRLVRWGVISSKINITADPVFNLGLFGSKEEFNKEKEILFVPRFPIPKIGKNLFMELTKVVIQQKGAKLSTVVFHNEKEIKKMDPHSLGFKKWEKRNEEPYKNLFLEIQRSKAVISARYHGLVLAALCRKPFIGIGDPNKAKRICDIFHMPFLPWDSSKQDLQQALDQLGSGQLVINEQILDQCRKDAAKTSEFIEL